MQVDKFNATGEQHASSDKTKVNVSLLSATNPSFNCALSLLTRSPTLMVRSLTSRILLDHLQRPLQRSQSNGQQQ